MTLKLPPLTWLRAFEAAARHLSFTHAAAELNLTQAAISKQVKLLELHLREALFERRARSLVLTKVGEAYLPKVRDAFERLHAGTVEVFGARRSETLTLRVPVGLGVNWLAARLGGFIAAHPRITLRLVSTVWNEEFDPARYDLDIRYGLGRWTGFRADRLTWETMTPLCLPTLAARLTDPADLAGQRLIHVLGYQDGWAQWLAAAGVSAGAALAGALQVDNSLLAFELAAKGCGVALGRRSMRGPDLVSRRLVAPFALDLPTEEGFFLVEPDDGSRHPDARYLRDWLLAEAIKDRP